MKLQIICCMQYARRTEGMASGAGKYMNEVTSADDVTSVQAGQWGIAAGEAICCCCSPNDWLTRGTAVLLPLHAAVVALQASLPALTLFAATVLHQLKLVPSIAH
jgi:hypothetical protein